MPTFQPVMPETSQSFWVQRCITSRHCTGQQRPSSPTPFPLLQQSLGPFSLPSAVHTQAMRGRFQYFFSSWWSLTSDIGLTDCPKRLHPAFHFLPICAFLLHQNEFRMSIYLSSAGGIPLNPKGAIERVPDWEMQGLFFMLLPCPEKVRVLKSIMDYKCLNAFLQKNKFIPHTLA